MELKPKDALVDATSVAVLGLLVSVVAQVALLYFPKRRRRWQRWAFWLCWAMPLLWLALLIGIGIIRLR